MEAALAGLRARHPGKKVSGAACDVAEYDQVRALLARAGIQVTTMGRRPADDPSFFAVAGAAGAAACVAASLRDGTGTVQS